MMHLMSPRAYHFCLVLLALGGPMASAQPALADGLVDTVGQGHFPNVERALFSRRRFPVRVESAEIAQALGAVPITETWAVLSGDQSRVRQVVSDGYQPLFGPGQRLHLNQASQHNFLTEARRDFGLDGAGVFVGLVDTGVSVTHPSMRGVDGQTRIQWLLTFDREPAGLHPDLEAAYGCSSGGCAVFSAQDINEVLSGSASFTIPLDTIGHGTHVASTAAGRDANFPGVAPGADLLVVQSGGGSTALDDGDILIGAKFLMDRAAEAGRPVVINLSLGSNFGSHDGNSPLEQGLAALAVGPGRAIVVASGNEGSVYSAEDSKLPEPLGIHTEAAVVPGGETHVTLAPSFTSKQNVTAFAWISYHPGDEVEVAFQSPIGRSAFVPPGKAALMESSSLGDSASYEVGLLNGEGLEDFGDIPPGQAVFIWAGEVQGSESYELVFRGRGTVELWIQSAVVQSGGATVPQVILFPRARTSATVTIPASHPELITVGASVNRTSWTDFTGTEISSGGNVDGIASFSSAGPNHLGQMKPDLLAPGENLIAAMAKEADPRSPEGSSAFQDPGVCPIAGTECMVVDDTHAISSGTSMAAPQVTGTVALLLQRDPSLTMSQLRSLLRAGARAPLDEGYPSNWYGAGQLDVLGSLIAQDRLVESEVHAPMAASSRIGLGNTFLYPDPGMSMQAWVMLRDAEGNAASGFDLEAFDLRAVGGAAKVVALDVGILELELSAPEGSGGRNLELEVLYQGTPLVTASVPIGVDPTAAIVGYDVTGGCQLGFGRGLSPSFPTGLGAAAFGVLLAFLRSRKQRLGRE